MPNDPGSPSSLYFEIAHLRARLLAMEQKLDTARHDLKGLLMNVELAAMLMEPDVDGIPNGRSLLDVVKASVERMEQVISECLSP